jgi:hypothetical protein
LMLWHPLDQVHVANISRILKRLGISMTANKQTYTLNLTLICSNSENLDEIESLHNVVPKYDRDLLHNLTLCINKAFIIEMSILVSSMKS